MYIQTYLLMECFWREFWALDERVFAIRHRYSINRQFMASIHVELDSSVPKGGAESRLQKIRQCMIYNLLDVFEILNCFNLQFHCGGIVTN